MKRVVQILCLTLIWWPILGFASQGDSLFAIPAPEAEKFITQWLSGQGFTVKRTSDGQSRILLRAEKDNEQWEIILSPHSALGTRLDASFRKKDAADLSRVENLKQSLLSYIAEPQTVPGANSNQIPSVVLGRIESVVCLESITRSGRFQFSGFIIDRDGLILSTAHDLKGHQRLHAVLFDGRTAPGEVMRVDHGRDLALIEVDLKAGSHVVLENGRNILGMGEKLFSVGCPVNLRGTVFPGFINGPPRRVRNQTYWQVSMKTHPGSSGSPVFDSRGNLTGVVKGRFRGTDSVGFLIPFETIVEFVREIKTQ